VEEGGVLHDGGDCCGGGGCGVIGWG
jgi:hypothetical protein